MMLWKCCTQYASKAGKLSSGRRTVNSNPKQRQCQRMLKLLHSCTHLTRKYCSKFSMPGFSNTWTVNFQMFKLVLEKAEEPNCQHPLDHWKSKRIPEKHLFLLYSLCQSLRLCVKINCGKFWKRWEYQTTWSASWEICIVLTPILLSANYLHSKGLSCWLRQ